jgi:hypothetical protein
MLYVRENNVNIFNLQGLEKCNDVSSVIYQQKIKKDSNKDVTDKSDFI